MSEQNQKTYPAAFTMHTVHGPVPACVKHAQQLAGLGRMFGMPVPATAPEEGAQCINCINESLAAEVKAARTAAPGKTQEQQP